MKKLLLVALFALCTAALFIGKKITQNSTNLQPASHEQLKQTLADQEEAAWDLIATNTGITQEQCRSKIDRTAKSYKQSISQNHRSKQATLPALKPETVSLVRTILQDFNVDPNTVSIVPIRGLGGSAAAADDYTIYINEKEFCRFTPEACKFCIAHEIQHLKNHDHSTLQALTELSRAAQPSAKNKAEFGAALNNYRRFIEIRADMQALLDGGPEYSQGAFELMDKLWELDGCQDNPGITHPKTSHRIATAKNICSCMQWGVTT